MSRSSVQVGSSAPFMYAECLGILGQRPESLPLILPFVAFMSPYTHAKRRSCYVSR